MSTKKVYIHYEPSKGGTSCTESITVTDSTLVSDILAIFLERFNKKGNGLSISAAALQSDSGERLEPAVTVLSVVDNKADIFLIAEAAKSSACIAVESNCIQKCMFRFF